MSGLKNDEGKPEFDRLSFEVLGKLNEVHKYGDQKYEEGNWKKGLHAKRLINATFRHLSAYLRGERRDPESGLLHTAHAAVNCHMLTYYLLHEEKYKQFLIEDSEGN